MAITASNKTTGQDPSKLLTGAGYLESLDDGREVWYDGEKVKNVADHPAYRNAARSMARLYYQLHDPALKDDLLLVDKFGNTTHKFFAPSYNAQEVSLILI